MPAERPMDVLSNERGGMVRACTQRSDYFRRRGRVAEAHGEVAQPALVADAADRRAAQALVELRLGPGEELHQRGAIEAVARGEVRFAARAGKAVPRAHQLAVVAAVYAVADERAQRFRDGALVLDGEIGDAAPGLELVRAADCLRRADVDAPLAGAAAVLLLGVERQRQVAQDFAEEEPRAG